MAFQQISPFSFRLPSPFCLISSAGPCQLWSLAFRLHYSPKTKPSSIIFLCLFFTFACFLPPWSFLCPVISVSHLQLLLPSTKDQTNASLPLPHLQHFNISLTGSLKQQSGQWDIRKNMPRYELLLKHTVYAVALYHYCRSWALIKNLNGIINRCTLLYPFRFNYVWQPYYLKHWPSWHSSNHNA